MQHRCTGIVHKALAVVRPQFRLDFAGGIHGLPHWSRVWLHGRGLAASLDVNPAPPRPAVYRGGSASADDSRGGALGHRPAARYPFKLEQERSSLTHAALASRRPRPARSRQKATHAISALG
jgi:hypothetical protein